MPAPTTDTYTVPEGSGNEPLWDIPGNWSAGLPGSADLAVVPEGQAAFVETDDDVTVAGVDVAGELGIYKADFTVTGSGLPEGAPAVEVESTGILEINSVSSSAPVVGPYPAATVTIEGDLDNFGDVRFGNPDDIIWATATIEGDLTNNSTGSVSITQGIVTVDGDLVNMAGSATPGDTNLGISVPGTTTGDTISDLVVDGTFVNQGYLTIGTDDEYRGGGATIGTLENTGSIFVTAAGGTGLAGTGITSVTIGVTPSTWTGNLFESGLSSFVFSDNGQITTIAANSEISLTGGALIEDDDHQTPLVGGYEEGNANGALNSLTQISGELALQSADGSAPTVNVGNLTIGSADASGGVVDIDTTGFVGSKFTGASLTNYGEFNLGSDDATASGSSASFTDITNSSSGVFSVLEGELTSASADGSGSGDFTNQGSVTIGGSAETDAELNVSGDLTGDGSVTIEGSGLLSIGGSASGGTITFGPGGGEIEASTAASLTDEIEQFGANDRIDLTGIAYTGGQPTLDGDVLSFSEGGELYTLTVDPAIEGETFSASSDGVDGTMIACYCRGARILTDRGEFAVEDLQIGDRLVTLSGETRPIRWIGRRSYVGWLAAANPKAMPICFKAGALADRTPKRDLWVSPEHAMYLDDALVPAGLLVNGSSIVKAEAIDEVHYFHIELAEHDVIFAEGAASETFVDDDSRGMFHNAPEFFAAHPGYAPQRPAIYCAPRLEDGFALEHLRERLAARAALLRPDGTAVEVEIYGHHDVADRTRIAGWAFDRRDPSRRVGVVALCNGAVIARLTADCYRGDLESAGVGDGHHGFELSLGERLVNNQRHEIELRGADDWRLLQNSPKVIEAEGVGSDAGDEPIVALGVLRGSLDDATHRHVRGWAETVTHPNRPVILVVSANERVLGRVVANRFRPDLIDAGVGQGRHGFEFAIPGGLSGLEAQEIRVRRETDGDELLGSPWRLPAAGRLVVTELAELIAGVADSAEEDAALALLTQQTESLLARRAERTGGQTDREALRLFQRRWGRAPDEACESAGLRALVIDHRAPSANRDAGSVAILSHMRALQALGYAVTFASSAPGGEEAELARLANDEGISACGRPYYSGVEDVLCRHAGGFDVVYLHRLMMAERYLKLARAHMPKARLIYSVADLHHLRLARQARIEQRPELLAVARATERRELFAASEADLVITHSPVEAQLLRRQVSSHKVRVVPFAAKARDILRPFAARHGVAFVGGFNHAPNADAVYWLTREILPRVWAEDPSVTCTIAGAGWRADRLPGLDPRVKIVGSVADLDELFASTRLTVAPLRFGAGVKGKVLESFAVGLPCVMSEIAAEGLPLQGALAELVGRGADGLSARIVRFHQLEDINRACGLEARALVAEQFNQHEVTDRLREALDPSAAVQAFGSEGAVAAS